MGRENAILVKGIILPGDNEHAEFVWEGTCPYCGEKHYHNVGHDLDKVLDALGTRLAHCAEREGTEKYYTLTVDDNWRKEFDKREINKFDEPAQSARHRAEATREAVIEAEEILEQNLTDDKLDEEVELTIEMDALDEMENTAEFEVNLDDLSKEK